MIGHYDPTLVCVSLILSVLASWVALDLSARVHLKANGRQRSLWLLAGSFAMGIGIWSMHYVGMLAYRMDMPVLYDWPTVLVSMLAAVVASAIALWTVSRRALDWKSTAVGSLFMGGGIASMHYIGTAAMRMPATTTYSAPFVLLSIAAAVCISAASLRLAFGSRTIAHGWSWKKTSSALLMGFAIPCMHYLDMAAVHRTSLSDPLASGPLDHAISISDVSTAVIVLVSLLVLTVALLTALVDRRVTSFESALHGSKRSNSQLRQHNERLQGAFRASGVSIWECDPATSLFYVDPSLRELYGLAPGDEPLPREVWKARVHPDDVAALDRVWKKSLASGDLYENEYRIIRPNGEVRRVRSLASLLRSENGRLTRVLGMTWDVTAERQREQAVFEQAALFRMTLEAIGDAVISTDEHCRISFLNRAASELTGWGLQESVGKLLMEVFVTRDELTDAPRRNAVERCIESGGTFLAEDGVLVDRNGRRYNIRKHVAMMGLGNSAVITFQDITTARRLERDLLHSANHDSLTGLANRKAFEKRLLNLWEENRYSGRSHCLCILDLDRFKIINDTSGHLAGDALLREMAGILQSGLPAADLAARMGGDEFMLLLTDTTVLAAEARMNTLLTTIGKLRFPWHGREYDVTASLGLVPFDCFSPDPDVLISQADVALFTAKRGGRNQVSVYREENELAAGHHLEMEVVAEMRRSLDADRFELHAQPIVKTTMPGEARYFEILLRLRDENGKLVLPSVFIPAAERYGLMPTIDRWVLRRAFAQIGEFTKHLQGYRFAINLCGASLSDPSLWAYVSEELERYCVPPETITFEVTETGMIRNLQHAKAFMQAARDAGCCIALDDFGTGLSSLAYLKQFTLDTIKIDGAFVRNVVNAAMDQAIVRSVAEIAHSVGASTVAECVEDLGTMEILKSLGVDYIQGWATGKPGNLADILETLRRDQSADRALGQPVPMSINAGLFAGSPALVLEGVA